MSSNEQDRIRLGKAMDLKCDGSIRRNLGYPDDNGPWEVVRYAKFQPFTDANDDYAVLEWMRKEKPGGDFDDGYGHQVPKWIAALGFIAEAPDRDMWDYGFYKVGDYARAALKVIDDE